MTKSTLPPFGPAQSPRSRFGASQWLVPDDFDKSPAKEYPIEHLLLETKRALNLLLHRTALVSASFDYTHTPYGMIESVYKYDPYALAAVIGDIFDPGYATKAHVDFGNDLLGMMFRTFIPLNATELHTYRPWMSTRLLHPPYTAQPQEPESAQLTAHIHHGLLLHEYNPLVATSTATVAADAITTFLHRLDSADYIEIMSHTHLQDERFFKTASVDLQNFVLFLNQHHPD